MKSITLEELEKIATEKESKYKIINGDWKCKTCESNILAINVTFPIHDGPFPMSGSGRVQHQVFPYCPKCEKRPEFHGLPIKI